MSKKKVGYAGKKAIIVKAYEDGHDKRKFSHVLVAGIKRNPRKVTKSMSKKKVNKRSKIIPFVKHINYQHVMPTRYSVDLSDGLKKVLDGSVMADPSQRANARKAIATQFKARYLNQQEGKSDKARTGVDYFFTKLR